MPRDKSKWKSQQNEAPFWLVCLQSCGGQADQVRDDLTILATILGLFPMSAEKSLQARFLFPMAIRLAFGVMFATRITLLLVPSLYMILEGVKRCLLRPV